MGKSASSDQARDIVLELLRVGLLSIRCRAVEPKRYRGQEKELAEWAELCRSLPPMVIGGCQAGTLRFFLKWNVASFVQRYPSCDGTDYQQACGLLEELAAVVGPVEPE